MEPKNVRTEYGEVSRVGLEQLRQEYDPTALNELLDGLRRLDALRQDLEDVRAMAARVIHDEPMPVSGELEGAELAVLALDVSVELEGLQERARRAAAELVQLSELLSPEVE